MANVSDLSCYFPYERILAVAGVSVKGSVPDITACPLCRRPTLTVYADPLSGKSNWLRCGSCRFSGDTIETYQRISRNPTLADTIREAWKNGLCAEGIGQFTPANIQNYLNAYPSFRAKVRDVWDNLSRLPVEDPSPELVRHAQAKHLWGGWLRGPHKQMTRFLGGADRRTVDKLFDTNFGKRALPKRGFQVVLAVPYQDVPGRICGMRFLGREGDLTVPLSPFDQDEPEGGLAMLDALDGLEKTVFAVSSLDFALQAHKLNFTNRDAPLKMVAYEETTRLAWKSVNAERLVFWSDTFDWRLFKQAKQFDNAWISSFPRLRGSASNTSIYMAEYTPEVLLHTLDSSALPWPRFVAEWLMDCSRDPMETQATLTSARFTPAELDRVIHECPENRRDAVRRLLEEGTHKTGLRVCIAGKNAFERDGSWYYESRAGDSLISDAAVKLTCMATDRELGEVFLYGEVCCQRNRIFFSGESFREIEADPLKWLQDKTARAGLGFPRFDRSWTKSFMLMLTSLSHYDRVTVTERIGFNKSGDIMFPNFILRGGEILERVGRFPLPDAPALDVPVPEPRRVARPEPVTSARAAWLAAASVFTARLLGRIACPVYVVDGAASRSGISSFVKSSGMVSMTVECGNDKEKDRLAVASRRFNYPIHLNVSGNALDKLPAESYSSAFISTQRLTALSMCTREAGVILRDAPFDGEEEMPPFSDVILYLAYLQRHDNSEVHGNPVVSTLRDYCQYLGGYLSHFDEANVGIAINRTRLCGSPGDSLLELAALLCISTHLGLVHDTLKNALAGGYPPAVWRKAVCVDHEEGMVYLPRTGILRACQQACIPKPDLFRAERDLAERRLLLPETLAEGILIPGELWDETVRGYRRDLNQT